ncbi:MAG: hypothetical protein E5X80_04905 [Mesorhizobium sp.]|uniref:DUF6074 family protein n=1 Tax=Mesorhizobium sp. TaxID=1871066 RepID=UPI00120805C8|nr:DUF6074 family protein [Mesorhizobium sp.]TIO52994.1 MAG: hypothetical protein E5X78_10140 [Mesorhizobium sp.]TIO61827.1 MAG: hypothetical protein E5X79_05520 [Mesorhizobium sp.]TJV66718.1 MAG: hypothetical protein E5X80_04905 [Mesorhizobium sp.]
MSQLDLFTDYLPSLVEPPVLIAFPLSRRRDLIAETARGLATRNQSEGRKFWNRQVKSIRRDMKAKGIAKVEIDRQISDFIRVINIELDYRAGHWSSK